MLIHRKRRSRYEIQTPLTSLIDIVFLLLIYFLLTTNFITEAGISVHLPKAKAVGKQSRQEITVSIDKAGKTYLENRPVAYDDLLGRLQKMIHDNPRQMVVIKADRSVALQKAVDVMDIVRAAGGKHLFLATEKTSR